MSNTSGAMFSSKITRWGLIIFFIYISFALGHIDMWGPNKFGGLNALFPLMIFFVLTQTATFINHIPEAVMGILIRHSRQIRKSGPKNYIAADESLVL